ncbi:MAG: YihA family ribosome biogenesis GTP-binding protein, partial [Chlorobi bacterium]|nr:YihA family ribosome biogenesis GTP-binding protein [Chlorobiota bacterium]
DHDFIKWAGQNQIPIAIVFTKTDKISKNELKKIITQWQKLLSTEWEELPPMFVSSAKTRVGREELLNFIHDITQQIEHSSHKF